MNCRILLFFFALVLFSGLVAAECGNGTCEAGENQCTCRQDCGKCEGAYGNEKCKELACVSSVCKIVQKANCCGNEKCESGESYSNCAADCMPKSIDLRVVSPDGNDSFLFGENVRLLVDVLADNAVKVVGAEVTASGVFRTIFLYNDGLHDDGTAFDSVYGNFFTVKKSMLGSNAVTFQANFRGITGKATASFFVKPDLNVSLFVPEKVALGDVLNLRGTVKAKQFSVAMALDANIFFQGRSVFSKSVFSDANTGAFFLSYPVSLLSKLGTYSLSVKGTDANGNSAFFEKSFEVVENVFEKKILVEISDLPKKSFLRGEEIPLVVSLFDESGNPIEKADVSVSGLGIEAGLFEFSPGKYSASIEVPFAAKEGDANNVFTVSAVKKSGNIVTAIGTGSFSIAVEKTGLALEFLQPKEDSFKAGETINFEVLAYYSNSEKIQSAKVFVLLGEKEIQLVQTEPSRFSGTYTWDDSDYAVKYFTIKATDSFGNTGFLEKKIDISGETPLFFLSKNFFIILAGLAVFFAVLFAALGYVLNASMRRIAQRRSDSLESKARELQENYFKKGIITRKQYEEQMQKLGGKLGKRRKGDS